jgi:anti-sigma-K factor RskA
LTIRELIESGNLELYVAQLLPADEAAAVEAAALAHPEVRAAIAEIEQSLEAYAQAQAIQPSADLKNRILEDLNTPEPSPNTAYPKRGQSLLMGLVVGLGFLSAFLLYQYFALQKNIEKAEAEKRALIDCQKSVADLKHTLDIIRHGATRAIALNGLPLAPDAKVTVYWNTEVYETYLAIQNLPPLPKGKQYQLWAIVNTKPVDAGLLTIEADTIQAMKPLEKADAFAITIEPEGGSAEPSIAQMIVLGTVTK